MNIFKIAKSYILSKSKTKLTKMHSYIAVFGITIGVTALIVVSSAMNGFTQKLYEDIGFYWDIDIVVNEQSKDQILDKISEEETFKKIEVFKFLRSTKIKVDGFGSALVYIFNDEQSKQNQLKDDVFYVANNNLINNVNYISVSVCGKPCFNSAKSHDVVDQVILPIKTIKLPLNSDFRILAITEKTFEENFLTDLSDQLIYNIGIRTESPFNVSAIDKYIQNNGDVLSVSSWHINQKNLYTTLQLEQTVIKLVLFFIILVSCFNVVSTLTLIITEKKQDIFVLKTIGYSNLKILSIFLLTGSLLGIMGLILGTVLGILITINLMEIMSFMETALNLTFLPTHLKDFPYILNLNEIININILTGFFILFASLLPALTTVSINPAEGLKDE